MKKNYLCLLTLTIAFILALGDMSLLFAQETATEEFTLEEITVTAQKREENSQKVPIAMEVISGEELAVKGKNSVDEILKDVANVFINTASDGMRISLRGIADDSNVSDDQHVGGSTVAVNIDGSYNSMSNAGQNLFDIERVEVLFGPQSTMYGSNAPGGIVNVVTAAPKTDTYSANGSIEVGTYDLLNLQAAFNAPVIQDKVALRLSANSNKLGSYTNEDQDPNKTTSARLKALWSANDDLSFTVTGTWSKRSNGGMMGGSVKPFVDQDSDTYPDGTKLNDPWTQSEDEQRGGNRDDQITKGLSADINWSTPFGNVSAVPSYSKSTSEGRQTETNQQGTQTFYQEQYNEQKGAELRMTNAKDFELFQWIFGGTYYNSEQFRGQNYLAEGSTDSTRKTIEKKKALYANITYPLWFNDRLRLTLGYRQSWDTNNSSSTGMRSETSGNPEEYSKPDLKYGFEYDAADNLMFFGSFASSYRSGNAMAMPDSDGNYPDPEELDSYNVGAKSRWFGNKLQVNVSAYYYDYANKLCSGYKEATGLTEYDLSDHDIATAAKDGRGNASITLEPDGQYPTMDTSDDLDGDGLTVDDIYNFQINDSNSQGTGQFTSLGLDLQVNWIVTSKDKLNFSVAYLDSQWKTLRFHYYYNMYWPDENYKGVTPTNSPKWSMTASYEHNFMLGSYGTLTPRIDVQHKTGYSMVWNPADKDPEGYGHQEPYYLCDVSAGFSPASGKWGLNAYVKNITNYAVKRSYMGMMSYSMMLGDPRTYGISMSVRF